MTFDRSASLRIAIQEDDIRELMARYPMLSRTEIADVISRSGPMLAMVEAELARISRLKR
jgi:hypothetical protein